MTEAAATAQASVAEPGAEIGLGNRLRARWHALPETHRAAICRDSPSPAPIAAGAA